MPDVRGLVRYDPDRVEQVWGCSQKILPGCADAREMVQMIDWFVTMLNRADQMSTFGTEGWRKWFGVEE